MSDWAVGVDSASDFCVERHTAYIFDRGGQNRIGQLLRPSLVEWSRQRDEVTEARVIISGGACSAQASFLGQIEPKRQELVIFRGQERVWEGPIWRVGWESNRVEIVAHDVFEYLKGRPLSKVWDNTYQKNGATGVVRDKTTTVVRRAGIIAKYELTNPFTYKDGDGKKVTVPSWESVDPPANIEPFIVMHEHDGDARTSTITKALEMSVGEHIDNLARASGLDYVVVGRSIHFWDVHQSIGRGRTLTEADFYGDIIVTAYGADHTEIAVVVAEDGRSGVAGSESPYYGPWAKTFTVYNEDESNPPTQSELNSQAQRNLTGRSPVPVEVRVPDNANIRLSPSLGIGTLIPGVQFPLRATLNARRMVQMQKLQVVKVTESSEGESIAVTFVPAGKMDDQEGEA